MRPKLLKVEHLFAPLGGLALLTAIIAGFHSVDLGFPSLIKWNPMAAAAASAGFGTTSAVFFGLFQYFKSAGIVASESKLKLAMQGIKQAYEMLENDQPTRNVAWVNAARLILRAELATADLAPSHRATWDLFREEWRIRLLKFLIAEPRYYFGLGPLETVESYRKIDVAELNEIAEESATDVGLIFLNSSSSLQSNTHISTRAVAVMIQFVEAYDAESDPLNGVIEIPKDTVDDQLGWMKHTVYVYLAAKQRYYFSADGVSERSKSDYSQGEE